MPYDILMPQLGLTMTEGSVTSWLKRPGESVEKGEVLFTVETDKVEMEVESPAAGYLGAILLEPKKTVPTGTPIAVIVDKPEEIAALAARIESLHDKVSSVAIATPVIASVTESSSQEGNSLVSERGEFPASPRARRLAVELGVDLRHLKPARGARIVEEDVKRWRAAQSGHLTTGTAAICEPESGSSRVRRIVADRMTKSFQRAPHFYLGVEVNASELVRFREGLNASERAGAGFGFTDLFVKALAKTLCEQPGVNAYWTDGQVVKRNSVDIAFAVQAGELLLVPVIRNAAALDLFELSKCRHELTEKARLGKLTLAEMEGGSATLSNLGTVAIDWCQAILNPPQSVMIAAGQIARRPMVIGDRVEACFTVTLTLSVDHRVLDGVAGANFLRRIKELLEYPQGLLL